MPPLSPRDVLKRRVAQLGISRWRFAELCEREGVCSLRGMHRYLKTNADTGHELRADTLMNALHLSGLVVRPFSYVAGTAERWRKRYGVPKK